MKRRAEDLTLCLDGDLLHEFARSRREPAFAEVVRRHGGMVWGLCHSVLGNRADAEDATQAVFLILAQRASSMKGHPSVAGWLHQVAWYVASRAARAAAARRRHEAGAALMKRSSTPPQTEDIPLDLLHAGLADLPPAYREALLLHHLEGRSEPETAKLLGCSTSAVSARLSRGRKMLRARLVKRGMVVSVAGLTAAMATQATASVAPALTHSISHAATAVLAGKAVSAVASVQALAFLKGALNMLAIAKMKVAGAVVTAFLLLGGTLAYQTVAPGGTPSARPPAQYAAVGQPAQHDGTPTSPGLMAAKAPAKSDGTTTPTPKTPKTKSPKKGAATAGNGATADAQNGNGQNGDGQNGDGQNGDGQNGDGQNGDGQHGDGAHNDGQHGDGQHGDGQHGDGQNGNGQNGNGQNGNGQNGAPKTGASKPVK